MKNRHLSKAVASQKFYEFRTKLKEKCDENGIELGVADRWYASSEICHCYGASKIDLKLSDRIYRCDCGYVEDRDFNAALNLRAVSYTHLKLFNCLPDHQAKIIQVVCLFIQIA